MVGLGTGGGHIAQIDGGGASHIQVADTGNGGAHGDGWEVQGQVTTGPDDPCRCGQGGRAGAREGAVAGQRYGARVGLVGGGGDATAQAGGASHFQGGHRCHITQEAGVICNGQAEAAAGHRVAESDQLGGATTAASCVSDESGVAGKRYRAVVSLRAGGGHSAQIDSGGASHSQIADTGDGGAHGDGWEVQCQVIAGASDPCCCGQGGSTGAREGAVACQSDDTGVGLVAGGGDATVQVGGARNGERTYVCHRTLELGIVSDSQVEGGAGHRAAESDQLVGAGIVCRQDGVGSECDCPAVGLRAGSGDVSPDVAGARHSQNLHICYCTLELGIVRDGQVEATADHGAGEGDQLGGATTAASGVSDESGVGGKRYGAVVSLRAGGEIRTQIDGPRSGCDSQALREGGIGLEISVSRGGEGG